MTKLVIHGTRTALTFQTSCCLLAASLLWGCGPSEDAAPTANNPSPNAPSASPSIAPTNEYSVGDKISFVAAGNSKSFKVSGWSDAERTHSWTAGHVSVLAMRISPTNNPLTLKM